MILSTSSAKTSVLTPSFVRKMLWCENIQNIIDNLGTQNIKRIRVGIGESEFDTIDYVLSKPTKDEKPLIQEAVENAAEALKDILKMNFDKAMTKYN